jgi:5'-nucleotidase
MPVDLSEYLVIGISSRALFDLKKEDELFRNEGLLAYRKYQIANESQILEPGAGFSLVKAILKLNKIILGKRKAEVVVMSQNSSETSLRIFNSIEHHNLDITRAALVGGASLAPYLHAYKVDLFLSLYEDDVQAGINSNVASAILYDSPSNNNGEIDQIRIAFDGDAVIFSDESERIYTEKGLEEFLTHEKENAKKPLPEGPFAKLLKTLSYIQARSNREPPPIRTALVTARNSPAHERVIRTLIEWNVIIDEAHFLGDMEKAEIVKAFKAHMFFDDQRAHCERASEYVPTGLVPCKQDK